MPVNAKYIKQLNVAKTKMLLLDGSLVCEVCGLEKELFFDIKSTPSLKCPNMACKGFDGNRVVPTFANGKISRWS